MLDLKSIFRSVSTQMHDDLEAARSAFTHPTLKGDVAECAVRDFLAKYLPKNLEVSTGVVVDSYGNSSQQMDVLIHDAARSPVFYSDAAARVLPVECVYAGLEVKSVLNEPEIKQSFEKTKSLKSLHKNPDAFFGTTGLAMSHNLYGSKYYHWPVLFFVFSFDGMKMESTIASVFDKQKELDLDQGIDLICNLSRGVVFHSDKNNKTPRSLAGTDTVLTGSKTEDPLLFFYALASSVLNQAEMLPFNIQPYMYGMRF